MSDRTASKFALSTILICLLCNLFLFLCVRMHCPDCLLDYRSNTNSDARDYLVLGRNLMRHGHYSRCKQPPYAPDMLRTPVYPLFVGVLDWLGGSGANYLGNVLLQAGSCIFLFILVRSAFGARIAFWSSLLLATDLMLAIYNFETMSEPLFLFLLLAALASIIPSTIHLVNGERVSMGRFAVGGVLLGLSILTRPTALYLPIILGGGLLAMGWRRKHLAAVVPAITVLLLAIVFLPALWIARNALVCSLPRLTTVDAANNIYFIGGGAYQVYFNISLEEAHARIAQEHGIPTYAISQNPWFGDRSIAEIDAELRRATVPVMTKYPLELVKACLLGVGKASFSHNTDQLAYVLGGEWIVPGTGDLLRLRSDAWHRLRENGALLVSVFGWQLFHVMLSLIFALVGIAVNWRLGEARSSMWLFLFILLYFYVTVAVFGFETYYRCRIPVLPFLYVFAGAGLNQGWLFFAKRLKARAALLPVREEVVL